MEEWRQCGRWLIDCKVLPPNHRVVWPSAVVFDLAQALRDGVLLCQLLHNLSPGSIDLKDINFRPQMSQVGRGGGVGVPWGSLWCWRKSSWHAWMGRVCADVCIASSAPAPRGSTAAGGQRERVGGESVPGKEGNFSPVFTSSGNKSN